MSEMQRTLESMGFAPRRPRVFDSSMIKDYITCPSYFYMRHVLGARRRTVDPTTDTGKDWGTCWHAAIDKYHTTGSASEALKVIEAEFPPYIRADTDRHGRSKERMVQVFFAYLEHWKEQDEHIEGIRQEQYFNIYNEEDDLSWMGKIDRVVRHRGVVRAWDYKTASWMYQDYFTSHELGFQFPGYVWAGNQLGTPMNEITIDVIYTLKKSVEFFRRTFRYTPHQIQEWVRNVRAIIAQINYMLDHHLYDPEAWIKDWTKCTQWYFHRCPFFDIHSLPPIGDMRMRVLQSEYVQEFWHPGGSDQ